MMKAVSAMKRLREFHAELEPWRATTQVKQFDEQLRDSIQTVGL
jgi:hypothetical protein